MVRDPLDRGSLYEFGYGDSYWDPPEEKEGCENPWWCGKWGDD